MAIENRQYGGDWGHLFLTGWPFQTVPDETFFSVWADRTNVKEQVDRLVWRWHRVKRSTFHVTWADLGAGKSHTLQYIRNYFSNHPELGVLPVYAVMPKQMRNFLDVYQVLIARLDLDLLAELLAFMCNTLGRKAAITEIFPDFPDAGSALLKVIQGDSEKTRAMAADWLKGTTGLTRRHLDTIGVNRRVKTTDDAVSILSGIIRLVQLTKKYHRVLFMLDECQRIGTFKLSIGQDINTGLQTWYDSSPNHLTLVLSFGSGEERFVRHLLSQELQSREDYLHLTIPLLSKDEALAFIEELLEHFRDSGAPSSWFPFTRNLVEAVIDHIISNEGITPRILMKAFESLLDEADFRIGARREFEIDNKEASRIVDEALRQLHTETED